MQFLSPRNPARAAFTLVEMLGAMMIVSLAAVTGVAVAARATADLRDASVIWALHQDAAAALDRICLELRSVTKSATTQGPTLSSCSSTQLAISTGPIVRFIDAVGLTPGRIELVSTNGIASLLLPNAVSLTFTPRDAAGNALSLPLSNMAANAGVRQIQISLSCSRAGVTETLRTSVYLRCMAGF